ncbi:energy-coupling factor transporter transmembrane protein EcfT [bacterium]|nr:energy-coupling factor transporter transmembrane protein EcfT [bacterium]
MNFLNNLTLGQYVHGDSFLHRLDPRTKITIVGLFMIAVFFIERPEVLLICGLVCIGVGIGAGLGFNFLLRGLRFVWILALCSFFFNLFLIKGEPICEIWGWTISQEGLVRGGAMTLRLILLVLMSSLLTLTTSPILLTDGMEKLLAWGKFCGLPAHELAMVCTIAMRFVPTLAQETDHIAKAQLARGASLDRGGILQRLRAILPIIIPLFVSAFRHAEDLAWAMESRCYRGGEGRTRLHELKFKMADLWAGLICVFFLISVKLAEVIVF